MKRSSGIKLGISAVAALLTLAGCGKGETAVELPAVTEESPTSESVSDTEAQTDVVEWEDLEPGQNRLHVGKTVQRIKADTNSSDHTALILDSPKSHSSIRTIPIIEDLAKLLEKDRKPGTFLLSGDPDRPMDPRVMQKHYKQLLEKSGVKDADFHATRRTFATRCAEKGVDAKTLSELMGHSDISTTLRYYVHPSMSHKEESIKLLTDLFAVKVRRQEG